LSETSTDSRKEPASQLPVAVRVLGWASLLNDSASEMVYALLPHFLLQTLGGNRFHVGLIEGCADATASLLKIWMGRVADRGGSRKAFIVMGYSVPALVRPLIGLATLPWHLFGARITDRLGKGIRTPPRDAMIADTTPADLRGRAFGYHRGMDNLGAAVGPLIAALFLALWPEQLRLLFLVTLLPGLLVVALLWFRLPDTRGPVVEPVQQAAGLPSHYSPGFVRYMVALLIFTLGNSSDAFLLVRAGELGVPILALPLLWCACHVAKSGSNFLLGRLIDQWGARRLLPVAWCAFALVYAGFALAGEASHMWALFIAYGLVMGLVEPAERTLVGQLVGRGKRGMGYAWYSFTSGMAALPASLACGALYQVAGPMAAFGYGAALAMVAVTVLATVRQPAEAT
jgi:MFS family permease